MKAFHGIEQVIAAIDPLGALIALIFTVCVVGLLSWMLLVPRQVAVQVARARRAVGGVKRILVPLEWGVASDRAVELACRLGKEQHADIYLAYIIEIPRTRALNNPLHEKESAVARDTLKYAEQIVRLSRLRAVTMVERSRETYEGILRLANDIQPDLIVLGMPPLYSTVRGLVGMITLETVMKRANCEVLVSKMPG